jgi:tripartite-type tricarboxylate transporter receptor subunit TctC
MWASASPLVMSPAYNRNTPYDPLKDFAPVSIYFYLPYVIAGGALHLATELMLNMSGTKMLHVPYRGTPAMTLDVISGQIDLMTNSTSMTAPHIASGRVRAIGVTSSKRSVQLPDVPTLAEAGLPGYEFVGWYSMVAPAGTPREIVATLNRNFIKALEAPAVKANIAAEGALPGGNTPEEFAAYLRGELDKYTKLVKSARLTPDS